MIKLLMELVNHKNNISNTEKRQLNLDESLTKFHADILKSVVIFSSKIDYFYNLNRDLRVLECGCQLWYTVTRLLRNDTTLKLGYDSDIMLSYLQISKVNLLKIKLF